MARFHSNCRRVFYIASLAWLWAVLPCFDDSIWMNAKLVYGSIPKGGGAHFCLAGRSPREACYCLPHRPTKVGQEIMKFFQTKAIVSNERCWRRTRRRSATGRQPPLDLYNEVYAQDADDDDGSIEADAIGRNQGYAPQVAYNLYISKFIVNCQVLLTHWFVGCGSATKLRSSKTLQRST